MSYFVKRHSTKHGPLYFSKFAYNRKRFRVVDWWVHGTAQAKVFNTIEQAHECIADCRKLNPDEMSYGIVPLYHKDHDDSPEAAYDRAMSVL